MRIVDRFPHEVVEDRLRIPMSDGIHLAGRIWRPSTSAQRPVPAVLEYIPYRQRDLTAVRDAMHHPYFAGHGFAGVRVDLRGSGDSEGVLTDEYLEQELATRRRCWPGSPPSRGARAHRDDGHLVGRLQRAAGRRAPAARASGRSSRVCFTDDRYADDVHYMGGCLLTRQPVAGRRRCSPTTPARPTRQVVGDRWREMWLERLRRQRALAGGVAAPPAPRRLLAARLGLRGLRRDRVPGARGQRLGRRLLQRRLPAAGRARRAAQGAGRSVVAQVPAPRPARARAIGFLQELRALVGPLAQGRGQRRDGRAHAARLDAGQRAAVDGVRGAARAAGSAEASWPSPRVHPRRAALGDHRIAAPATGATAADRLTSRRRCPSAIRRQVVPLRRAAGPALRPARGGRRLAGLRQPRR